ncbi:unnamed protein product [Acanthoscelides obtectus]|nr:unnamed protein product [Acanthoscelides obtectus]CAK1660982.1 Synaptic vesicle glycoprotein 2B [Acanthoscelides obtectus]
MSEFYRKEYRSSAKLLWGVMGSVGNLFLPLLAWLILDYHWSFNVGGHEYHTWNIFLLICAMFPLAGGICYMFMPESPKYLMNSGNNQKAMKVFQKVYTINTGRPKSTYPHQCLARETNSTDDRPIKRSALQTMVDGIKQLKLFMHKPYTSRAILGCTAALTMSSSFNTMRIWLPQIFKAINDYQLTHNGTSTDICIMLKSWHEEADNPEQVCMQMDSSTAYIHSGIVALTRLITYIVATAAINFVGSKKLLLGTLFGTSLLSGAMYFTQTANAVLVTSALSSALGNVSSLMFVSITVEMFPTSLRTVAISLHHTCARLATLLGNMVFPYILQAGCIPTFSFVALGPLIAGMLAMFYPDMDNKPLT